jgi:hypothetical protein
LLDAVGLGRKSPEPHMQAWLRDQGAWHPAYPYLAPTRGLSPPPTSLRGSNAVRIHQEF